MANLFGGWRWIVALVVFGRMVTGVACAEPIPAEHLFPAGTVSGASLSPDGESLAILKRQGNLREVSVVDRETDEASVWLTTAVSDITFIAWANNERLLVGLQTWEFQRRGHVYYFLPIDRIFSVNGSEQVEIFNDDALMRAERAYYQSIIDVAPAEPDHIYVPARGRGRRVELARVNILTGDAETVAVGSSDTFHWAVSDGAAVTRIDLIEKGSRLAFYEVHTATGEWVQTRIETRDLTDRSNQFWPMAPAENVNQQYVIGQTNGEEFAGLKIYDRAAQTFSDAIDAPLSGNVSEVLISPTTGRILGAGYWTDRYGVHFFDQSLARHFRGLQKFFDGDSNVSIIGLGEADGEISDLLIYVSSPTIAGEIYLYDTSDRRVSAVTASNPLLVGREFGQTEIVSFEATDGLVISGYLTHPVGVAPDEPAPFVLIPHGGPALRDYYDFDPEAQFLASRGYRVFKPNFRGSSGLGKSFEAAGFGEWGGAMQQDLTDALKWVFGKGLATPETTCVVGGSYGGYAALKAATDTPELISCAVSVNGVTDLLAMIRDDRRSFGRGSSEFQYLATSLGDPKADKERLQERSPINAVSSIEDPILLVHGEADRRIDVDQARKFNRAAKRAGVDIHYEELAGVGHSDWPPHVQHRYLGMLEAFLSEHIGGE